MTHNERVLHLLSDHRWHTHHEVYALHVIGHSRIADLRKRGHRIEHRRNGDVSEYRLLNAPQVAPSPEPPRLGCVEQDSDQDRSVTDTGRGHSSALVAAANRPAAVTAADAPALQPTLWEGEAA